MKLTLGNIFLLGLFFQDTASPTYDVPDCSGYEVEIGPDSTNDIYTGRFQVSPVHTTGNKSKINFTLYFIA